MSLYHQMTLWQKIKFRFNHVEVVSSIILNHLTTNNLLTVETIDKNTGKSICLSINVLTGCESGFCGIRFPHSIGRISILDANGRTYGDWSVSTFKRILLLQYSSKDVVLNTNKFDKNGKLLVDRQSIEQIVNKCQKLQQTSVFQLLSLPNDQWGKHYDLMFEVIQQFNCQQQLLQNI